MIASLYIHVYCATMLPVSISIHSIPVQRIPYPTLTFSLYPNRDRERERESEAENE